MVRAFYWLAFSPAETAFPGLDSGVVAAAFAAGVPHSALGEMQNLIAAGPLTRVKPEPKRNITAPKPKALEELEGEEADSRGRSRRAWIKCPAQCTAQRLEDPGSLVEGMVRFMDGYRQRGSSSKSSASPLGTALDGSGSQDMRGQVALNLARRSTRPSLAENGVGQLVSYLKKLPTRLSMQVGNE